MCANVNGTDAKYSEDSDLGGKRWGLRPVSAASGTDVRSHLGSQDLVFSNLNQSQGLKCRWLGPPQQFPIQYALQRTLKFYISNKFSGELKLRDPADHPLRIRRPWFSNISVHIRIA